MEIHFEIEHGCLLKCRHCSSFATLQKKELNYTVKEMIDFLQLFSEKKYVYFTGGEPLLNEMLDDIIFSLKSALSDVSIGIFTTGIMSNEDELCAISKEQAHSLATVGLEVCYFSIYSAQAKRHDWMTKINGSFSLTLKSIRRLCKQNIKVKINLVVTKRNQAEINNIIELASLLGCTEVRLLRLVNHGRAKQSWLDIGLSEQEYRETVLKIISAANKEIKITASGCSDILPCRPFNNAKGCQAGSRLAYITYEGNVFPCACTKNNEYYKIGQLSDITTLEHYFKRKKDVNDIALCSLL